MSTEPWITLNLLCATKEPAQKEFAAYVSELGEIALLEPESERLIALERVRRNALQRTMNMDLSDRQPLVAAIHVLTDLARQGWRIRSGDSKVEVAHPIRQLSDPLGEKQRVRSQLHAERDQQLRKPSVQAFVRSMEQRQVFKNRFVSIFSLMRDGRELADQLKVLRSEKGSAEWESKLEKVIAPYLQIVDENKKCEWTGLKLQDVWRYFRHTWSNAYNSVPGRTMMILIRDAAAKFHPIIGIAALSSPAVQIRIRDDWIGWSPEFFLKNVRERPTLKVAKWLQRITDQAIEEIYKSDLLEDAIVSMEQLRNPTEAAIAQLEEEAVDERKKHHRFMEERAYKKTERTAVSLEEHWEEQARSPLFRSKRSETLTRLLWARLVLRRFFDGKPTLAKFRKLLEDPEGRRVVAAIVRKAKADRVGVAIADISVCGALPPYNEILGGKLVSMLLASPEVAIAYHDRYESARSIIASSMAGRPVVRSPRLVCLTTTSLYGAGSSQYNRITIPCEKVGGQLGEQIQYVRLGETVGFGTGHFGPVTVQELTRVVERSESGQRVNSIFGEGVNPRLRKVRDGLDTLGFPSDQLLVHGSPRLVYGIPLARNFSEYLLGIDEQPDYYLPIKDPKTATRQIVDWWAERWLAPRIQRDEVLARITQHTLVYPIRHGARVPFVSTDPDQMPHQMQLFDEIGDQERI